MKGSLYVSPHGAVRRERALAWLSERSPSEPLIVIGPSVMAGADLLRAHLTAHRDGPGAFVGWQSLTLAGLAGQIAGPALAEAGRTLVSGLARQALCARVIHRAEQEGTLAELTPLARRPGFPRALARTLDELAMAAIDVGRLGAEAPALGTLTRAYAAELDERGLADRAWLYALAAQVLGGDGDPPLLPTRVPLLLYDVAVESRREAVLVAALAKRATTRLGIVPASDERARRHHEEALGVSAVALENDPLGKAEPSPASLVRLQHQLFEAEAEAAPLDDSVTFLSTPGESREAVEMARIALSEAERGVPFDAMAVLLRSPEHYVDPLLEAFDRAAIPLCFERGTKRPDPAGRALLALLACADEGLSASRFAEYLSLGTAPATIPTPRRWERLLVDAAVIGGRARWSRRLDGLERALEIEREELDDDDPREPRLGDRLGALRELRRFAMPLIERLDALPREATWGQWLDQLDALVVHAIRQPARLRELIAELAPMGPVGPVALDDVQLVIGRQLAELVVPSEGGRAGKVLVASAEEARGMCFDLVFVPGLAEKIFPRKVTEDPLALDALRARLSPDLMVNGDRVAAERRALRLAVGAARRRVVLSYPRIDVERSRPRVPSFYGLEVLRAAEGVLPGFDELARRAERGAAERMGWPAPRDPGQAIDSSEYDLAVLERLLRKPAAESRGAARYLLGANPHLARALRFRARQWKNAWTRADGMLRVDEETQKRLSAHRLAERVYSPTALELFARCPYRFFLSAIQRLAPRETVAALEELDPRQRGRLIHEIQMRLMRGLKAEGALPVSENNLPHALARLDEEVAEVASQHREQLAPAIERVWEDGVEEIRRDLREWLMRSAEEQGSPTAWRPRSFELAFGLPARSETVRSATDPDSVDEPVQVAGVRLRGSIDLVEERRAPGTSGEPVTQIRATDHKTGRAPEGDVVVIGGGKRLQPLLYALALEALEPSAQVVEGRLYHCTSAGGYAERVVPLDERGRDRIRRVLQMVDRAIDLPFLPAHPEPGGCEHCDYLSVCGPREEHRSRRKPRPKGLQAMREEP